MTKREIKRRIIAALRAIEPLGDLPTGHVCNHFGPPISSGAFGIFERGIRMRKDCVKAKIISKRTFKKLTDR